MNVLTNLMVMPTDLIPLLPSTMDEAIKIPIFGYCRSILIAITLHLVNY